MWPPWRSSFIRSRRSSPLRTGRGRNGPTALGSHTGPQRTVDPVHVNELADRFTTGITKSAPNCRLGVTMSPNLFKRTIRNTVRVVNNKRPAPALPLTEDTLLQQVHGMMRDTSDSFDSYPVLYLPDNYDIEEEPIILQSGRHRVTALLQLFSRTRSYTGYDAKLLTPE